jgi:hypothetical protein
MSGLSARWSRRKRDAEDGQAKPVGARADHAMPGMRDPRSAIDPSQGAAPEPAFDLKPAADRIDYGRH